MLDRFGGFEVSDRIFWLCMIGFVFGFFVYAFDQLSYPECFGYMRCFDYDHRERDLFRFSYPDVTGDFDPRHTFTLLILEFSQDFMGNSKIAPMLSSGIFVLLVGLLGRKITGRNFFGVVPAFLMVIDPIFLKYSVSITYPNFWATMFLFSCLLVFTRPVFSGLSWALSIGLKIVNFAFLPILVILSDFGKKTKILLVVLFFVLYGGLVYAFKLVYPMTTQVHNFDLNQFVYGLSMWSIDMRGDMFALALIFVVLFFMMILNKYKVLNARKMLLCLLFFLVNPAIISAFTIFTIEPYRFLVMICFVYVGFALGLRNIVLISEDLKKFGKKK